MRADWLPSGRRLLWIAMLSTTTLIPVPALADPVNAIMLATAIGSSWVGTLGLSVFATIAIQTGIAIAGSLVAGEFAPKASVPKPSDIMVNNAQPVSYQERGYGRVRKGGAMGFSAFGNKRRHYTVMIAAHSTKGPVTHYLDDIEVELYEEGNPANPPTTPGGGSVVDGLVFTRPMGDYDDDDGELGGPWFRESSGRIRIYTGKPGQAADPDLLETFDQWTAAHDFAGISYAAIWAKRVNLEAFNKKYPRGREWVYSPVWDMNDRVFDPRDFTLKFTRNAALAIAHELVTYWGHTVDWDEIAAEADVCDEMVTNAEGGTQPRWRVDVTIKDDMDFETAIGLMTVACDGWIYERADGRTGLRVGRWIEPTTELTDADFPTFQISEGEDLGAPNEFTIQYPEPQNQWKESPSGAWVHDPDGREVRDEISVNGCSSHNQASRLNKRRARRARARYSISGKVNLAGYDVTGQRFIRVRHSELSLVENFEVLKLIRNRDLISFQVDLRSAKAEDFAFDAATEEPTRPVYDKIPNDGAIDIPTGLTAEVVSSTGGAAALLFHWPAQDDSYGQQLRYRSDEAGLPDWQVVSIPVDAGQTTALVTGLSDGAFYEAQLRNRTGSGSPSDWSPAAPLSVQAIANQTPPGALSDFLATAEAVQARITFTAPDDANYYATRIYRADDSTDFDDAELVTVEYGLRAASDEWVDTGLASGDYSYWGRPINSSGIAGPFTARRDVTIP